MNHLFIINPAARKVKGRINAIIGKISAFFKGHPDIRHDIFVSEWCRDAVTYIRRYIIDTQDSGGKAVRVHAIGGTGTLFEVVNGVFGFSGVQVAAHPYGRADSFLQYFGQENVRLFSSMESQVLDGDVPLDVIRCGHNYGICYGLAGLEAHGNVLGDKWIDKGMPADISYVGATVLKILTGKMVGQHYRIDIDGTRHDGDYATVMVANAPCYGDNLTPAVDAHPDDGTLEVYLFKSVSKVKTLASISQYVKGNHHKIPDLVIHLPARKVSISSDETICMNIDGERFYGNSVEYEIIPSAIRFACPKGIDLGKLPRIYNRPEEGFRDEQ